MHKSPEGGGKKHRGFVSPQELAPLMGVTRQTIQNWIHKGDIRAHHISHRLKIPVDEALRILRHYKLPIPDWLKDEQPQR